MKDEDKTPVNKLREEEIYKNLSQRQKNLLLVYEDKTILLFGEHKKKNGKKRIY